MLATGLLALTTQSMARSLDACAERRVFNSEAGYSEVLATPSPDCAPLHPGYLLLPHDWAVKPDVPGKFGE